MKSSKWNTLFLNSPSNPLEIKETSINRRPKAIEYEDQRDNESHQTLLAFLTYFKKNELVGGLVQHNPKELKEYSRVRL